MTQFKAVATAFIVLLIAQLVACAQSLPAPWRAPADSLAPEWSANAWDCVPEDQISCSFDGAPGHQVCTRDGSRWASCVAGPPNTGAEGIRIEFEFDPGIDRPHFVASNPNLPDIQELAEKCNLDPKACAAYGFREEEHIEDDGVAEWPAMEVAHNRRAIAAYTAACSASVHDGRPCERLYFGLSGVDGQQRIDTLNLACRQGVLAACELAGIGAESRGHTRAALQAWAWGCTNAGDPGACARVGLAYNSTMVEGTKVLKDRDLTAAVYHLRRGAYDDYTGASDPRGWRLALSGGACQNRREDGRRALSRSVVCGDRKRASELLGDLYLAGDGVPRDVVEAARLYISGSRDKWAALVKATNDPALVDRMNRDQSLDLDRVERMQDENREARALAQEERLEARAADARRAAESDARDERNRARARAQDDASRKALLDTIQQAGAQATQQITRIVAPRSGGGSWQPSTRPTASPTPHAATSSPDDVVAAKPTRPAGPSAADIAAAETRKHLDECLSEPITQMRVTETNPFQVYVTDYQGLLDEAHKCTAAPVSGWQACIGMNARIWPDYDAQRDETNFDRRYRSASGYLPPGPSACLYNQTLSVTRNSCITLGKAFCLEQLRRNIVDMECALAALPRVWEAEAARNDSAAKTRHDEACRRRWR